ncbi:hypothetical protein E4U58_002528 [Claviceps cyperi]|nr:hypothetical protein E4U58_002528 [Claviceps cyperi]
MPRSQSTEPSGKNSIGDKFCSIKTSSTGEFEVVLAVEYKLPQKLPVALLVAALGNTTETNLDTGIVDEGGEKFGLKQLVPVASGMGISTPGKPTVFCTLETTPLVSNTISPALGLTDIPGDDDKMYLGTVSQLFAFVVQAIQAPQPTKEWKIAASELTMWKLKAVEIQKKDTVNY